MHVRSQLIRIALAVAFICASPARAEEADPQLQWDTPMMEGNVVLSHMLIAMSGRPNSEQTDRLLVGVKALVREQNNFRLIRSDGAELVVPRDSHMGDRMFSCMEKIENEARDKIGDELATYVHNLDTLTVVGEGIEIHHSGKEDFHIPLPGNQPWLPIHLKELHLKTIRVNLLDGQGKDVHRIKNIDGIACVVHSAGVDINIEPREFWRYRDKKGHTHVVLGIKSLIPAPVRMFFHFPEVVHFQFMFKKDHHRAEPPTPLNSSESTTPKSAPAGQPGS
jgi:hypothetical protein